MSESIWFTTRSALFRPGDAAWNEVAAYSGPLAGLLERRYPWLSPADRDDLVQDVLIEIKEALAAAHDRSRGRFRALLQVVVKRRVADLARRWRGEPLAEDVAAPRDEALEALDLEALLLDAFAHCRDELTQGPKKHEDALYALVDRIVHGLSSEAIAKKSGVSVDRVARLLERARDAVFAHLLRGELGVEGRELERALALFKECLRRPRTSAASLEKEGRLGAAIGELHARVRAAVRELSGDETARGRELREGLSFVLGEVGA